MKILFLTSRFPYPLEKGDKLRAFHQLKELSRNHEVILVSVSDQVVLPEHFDQLKPFCRRILVHHISLANVIRNLFVTFFSRLPFQVGYFYSEKFKTKIGEVIRVEKPDAIFCQLVRMAEYVKDVEGIPKTLDYMDAFSKGLERLSQRSAFPKKTAVRMEWKRMLKYERNIFDRFEHHTIISEQDKKLIPHPDHEKIHVIPNGVDMDFYRPVKSEKNYDLIFAGNMAYPPNVESALFIANEIMPLLWKQNPEINLVIAGATPANEILKLQSEHIEVTGWVDDMRGYFSQSKIHLAPMLISIGLQNKILQAMAMKIPCVVSTLANNAINAPASDCVFIADSPSQYAEKIVLLLNDHVLYDQTAENAFRFVKNNFDWTAKVKELEKVLLQK
ncbi:MAG: glycosyltransferase [Bacteroidetes bacterium]|nr:glycosyltransferase [Bacteroidota bacterium]